MIAHAQMLRIIVQNEKCSRISNVGYCEKVFYQLNSKAKDVFENTTRSGQLDLYHCMIRLLLEIAINI